MESGVVSLCGNACSTGSTIVRATGCYVLTGSVLRVLCSYDVSTDLASELLGIGDAGYWGC